jgi:hypothetical protein
MALETGNYIADLVITNPDGADQGSTVDDHLRLAKKVAKQTFPGFEGAILVTGTDGGAVNAYTLTPTTALYSYSTKHIALFSPPVTNTITTPTLNVSTLGAKTIKRLDGTAVVPGELVAGTYYFVLYNGTSYLLINPSKAYIDDVRDYAESVYDYATQLAYQAALPEQTGNAGKLVTTDGTTASWTNSLSNLTISTELEVTGRLDEAKGADIASAATINLDTATGNLVHITGTTTITAITIASGSERTLVFDSALTLTHNASTLILPGGANITTAAGDVAKVRGDASGTARVVTYQRANGQPILNGLTPLTPALTPSAAANVDFLSLFTSSYDNYLIIGQGLKPSATDSLRLRWANAGTADSGSNYYEGSSTGSLSSATAVVNVGPSTLNTGKGVGFMLHVTNVNDAVNMKMYKGDAISQSAATPTYTALALYGAYQAANAISGFRLYWLGGANFTAAGSIRIYGYNNY